MNWNRQEYAAAAFALAPVLARVVLDACAPTADESVPPADSRKSGEAS